MNDAHDAPARRRTRPAQRPSGVREATEEAILDAAWDLVAALGPDGTTLRQVADAAGCTHALVTRYYGSKAGLVDAVGARLCSRVSALVERAFDAADPWADLLAGARSDRSCRSLLVRAGLGDLPVTSLPSSLGVDRLRAMAEAAGSGDDDRRSRVLAYAAASLVLGWITFEEFLVAGTGLGRLGTRTRDRAMAAAAGRVMGFASSAEPRLEARRLPGPPALVGEGEERVAPSSRDALLSAAIELFADRGPAAVSLRDIAGHAGVNLGLIHRHFGSREDLLGEALEVGNQVLLPAALASQGFGFDDMSQALHHSSVNPRLMARLQIDGVDIRTVRREFPVLRSLVDAVGEGAGRTRTADAGDPRLVAASVGALALGSVIWGEHLRPGLGLGPGDGIESAIADIARELVGAPRRRG